MSVPTPDVSVLIPTRDRPAFLQRALASCVQQVEAARPPRLEVVIADDGSEPAARAPDLGAVAVRMVRFAPSRGRNAARNAAMDAAAGRYLQFLDDDDVLEPGALAEEVAAADAAAADLLVCRWRSLRLGEAPGTICDGRWSGRGFDSLLAGEAAPTGAVLYRRSYVDGLRWDEGMSKLDDWDFFVRAAARGGQAIASSVVAYAWTIHPNQGVRRASALHNAREFYATLDHLREEIDARDAWSEDRRRRLAQYLYKELRNLARFDRSEFERRCREILDLDHHFVPRDEERQRLIRWACRLLGLRNALRLYARLRDLVATEAGTAGGAPSP